MRNFISLLLSKFGGLFKYLSNKIRVSPYKDQKSLFRKQIGYSTNKLSFLKEDSIIFDIGGYEGQWASDIYGMYSSNIHIFEPVPSFAENIQKRFQYNKKIKANSFGLSDKTQNSMISVNKDGSSIIKNVGTQVEVKLVDIIEYIKQNNINKIDLMKINIEGGEYALLNRLIDTGYINNIGSILVQFHNFFPEAHKEMLVIQNRLRSSHKPIYQYEFVWELWRSNKI